MELAEHICEKRAKNSKPEWIADILSRLVWLTDDNGKEICDTLTYWLSSKDTFKIQVALLFDELFLWENEKEMLLFLEPIERSFPEIKAVCLEAKKRWYAQFPNKSLKLD